MNLIKIRKTYRCIESNNFQRGSKKKLEIIFFWTSPSVRSKSFYQLKNGFKGLNLVRLNSSKVNRVDFLVFLGMTKSVTIVTTYLRNYLSCDILKMF